MGGTGMEGRIAGHCEILEGMSDRVGMVEGAEW